MKLTASPTLTVLLCGLSVLATASNRGPAVDASEPSKGSESASEQVIIGGQEIKLEGPTLDGQLDAQEQRKRITGLIRGLPYQQFARDSVVAPVRIHLRYIKDAAGDSVGHQAHFLFILHESLSRFSGAEFSAAVFEDPVGEGVSEVEGSRSTDVGAEELASLGIERADDSTQYHRAGFDLLDRVHLDVMIRIRQQAKQGQNRIDFELVPQYQNRWSRLTDEDGGGDYSGFRGWLTATSLNSTSSDHSEAVLVEGRLVFHEPPAWFTGRNYLRGKLPIVLQEAARDLRRKLKRNRPVD